eukprot:scaffold81129_cov56-Phaeocystis_antarctica.AAC.3
MVEDRDGHAPRTLARDAPIAAALGHGGDAVATHLGDPRHLTEMEAIDRGEPLCGGAEDGGLLRAPVVRVLVRIVFGEQQAARGLEGRDARRVALAQHVHAFEVRARLRRELACVVDGRERRGRGRAEAVLEPRDVIVLPVARRSVHEPRAALDSDVVASQHDLALTPRQGVPVLGA